jgi:hypothetical protein
MPLNCIERPDRVDGSGTTLAWAVLTGKMPYTETKLPGETGAFAAKLALFTIPPALIEAATGGPPMKFPILAGLSPTFTVAVTVFVAASITETLVPPRFAT